MYLVPDGNKGILKLTFAKFYTTTADNMLLKQNHHPSSSGIII